MTETNVLHRWQRRRAVGLMVPVILVLSQIQSGGPATPPAWAVPSQQYTATSASTRWRPPITPMVVRRAFDPPEHVWSAGHRGVDLAAEAGQEVRSAAAGRVTFTGPVADRSVVVISHGRLRTTYEPVTPAVEVGAEVLAGDRIGTRGQGGHCGTTCLHWGALLEDVYIDPTRLLTRYRPVLKTPRPRDA